jgi:zinc finger CCHC domain-containing protein 9
MGTGAGAGGAPGADEDDLHALQRTRREVEADERAAERARKRADVKAGKASGVVKAFGAAAPPAAGAAGKAGAKGAKVVRF